MDFSTELMKSLGTWGALLAFILPAIGGITGAGTAALAAIGAWKRNYAQGKSASFMLLLFVSFPLTQVIYGLVLMIFMLGSVKDGMVGTTLLGIGFCAGLTIGLSAYLQGKMGAAASDAMGETGKGFANDMLAIGTTEMVPLFAMAFTMLVLGQLTPAA